MAATLISPIWSRIGDPGATVTNAAVGAVFAFGAGWVSAIIAGALARPVVIALIVIFVAYGVLLVAGEVMTALVLLAVLPAATVIGLLVATRGRRAIATTLRGGVPRDDTVLRDATFQDVPALAELHVRTFQETHGGGPDSAVREQQWRSKLESGEVLFCVLLEAENRLIGFASGERHQAEPREYAGELNKIYLLRDFQRRGLGSRLLHAAAERFMAKGITSMLLFGDAKSRSNGFYEAMGGRRLLAPNGDFHGAYGWPDLAELSRGS